MSLSQALVAEQESKDSGGASIAEQVLSIMEIILDEANAEISEDKVPVAKTLKTFFAAVSGSDLTFFIRPRFLTVNPFAFCRATCC